MNRMNSKIQNAVIDFVSNPLSDENFANAVTALVEYREHHKLIQPPSAEPKSIAKQSKKSNSKVDFPTSQKQEQFKIISKHLKELGIKITPRKNGEICTFWLLNWGHDAAMLYMGSDWEIGSLMYGLPLKGKFEGFDLLESLDANGIDVSDW